MQTSAAAVVPRSRWAIVGLIASIALLDIVTGLRLMVSPAPWLLNGNETLWTQIAPEVQSNAAMVTLLHAAYGRMGAFSFHVGVITLLFTLWSRTSPLRLRALLVTYSLTGGAFFWFDRRYFEGTPYYWLKVTISVLWTAAIVAHFAFDRQPGRAVEGVAPAAS